MAPSRHKKLSLQTAVATLSLQLWYRQNKYKNNLIIILYVNYF
jgi:hypothetical protein